MNAVIMSAAKETNGQNTRYVRAAEKHGATVIRAVAMGNSDPAGVVARFQAAADKTDALRIRSAARPDNTYLGFPHDLVWGEDDAEIVQLARDADVIHLNNSYRAVRRIEQLARMMDRTRPRKLYERGRRFRLQKPMLLHHHGTSFRTTPSVFLEAARSHRMVSAVSTVDLMRYAPDGVLHWLPTVYDVAALKAYGDASRRPDDGLVRIGHFPTNRDFKHTAVFHAAVEELSAEGLPFEVVLSPIGTGERDGWSWQRTMAEKARCDIVFDQLAWGYGCNAVEAWAMGIPVVSGSDLWTDGKMREMWGDVPYALASESTLVALLRELILSADARADYAAKGMAHVLRYHDEEPGLARLLELYMMAIGQYSSQSAAA